MQEGVLGAGSRAEAAVGGVAPQVGGTTQDWGDSGYGREERGGVEEEDGVADQGRRVDLGALAGVACETRGWESPQEEQEKGKKTQEVTFINQYFHFSK